jgi:hypothetical protein
MRQNELEVVTADDSILELAHLMRNRCFDTSLEPGEGLIAELRGEDVSAASLAVMPFELYQAIRTLVDRNPVTIDPSVHFDNDDLTPTQLRMLEAFMKLELGIEVGENQAESDQTQCL